MAAGDGSKTMKRKRDDQEDSLEAVSDGKVAGRDGRGKKHKSHGTSKFIPDSEYKAQSQKAASKTTTAHVGGTDTASSPVRNSGEVPYAVQRDGVARLQAITKPTANGRKQQGLRSSHDQKELDADFIAFDENGSEDFAPTTTGPARTAQLQVYNLYRLKDVNTLLSLYDAEIDRLHETHKGVNYAAWIHDDVKMKFIHVLTHDMTNLERQRDFLQSRTEVPRAVFWPDLVNCEVRIPFALASGPKEDNADCIMDVEWGAAMPHYAWRTFHTMFQTHTLEGAKLGGSYLLKQVEVVRKSPLHYQRCGVRGGEEKSALLVEIEEKIKNLQSKVQRWTSGAPRAANFDQNPIHVGSAPRRAIASISGAPNSSVGANPAAQVPSTPTDPGEVASNKQPQGREPIKNLKRKAESPPNDTGGSMLHPRSANSNQDPGPAQTSASRTAASGDHAPAGPTQAPLPPWASLPQPDRGMYAARGRGRGYVRGDGRGRGWNGDYSRTWVRGRGQS